MLQLLLKGSKKQNSLSKERRYASVAQLVEQGTENPRVVGSIPTGGTICGFSSFGRASPCQGEGGGFEPRNPLHKKIGTPKGVPIFLSHRLTRCEEPAQTVGLLRASLCLCSQSDGVNHQTNLALCRFCNIKVRAYRDLRHQKVSFVFYCTSYRCDKTA